MVEMILQFADFALKRCPEQGKIQVMEQHFHVSCRTNAVTEWDKLTASTVRT